MPFEIIREDITKLKVDALVNPTNNWLYGTAGVDGRIHEVAGPELHNETANLGGCEVGEVKITKGYNLPASYVIHTVGPIWKDGNSGEEDILRTCYVNAMTLATEKNFKRIAIPLISSGTYGYPKEKALSVAISAISEFLLHHDMFIYLVVFDRTSFALSEKLVTSVTDYLEEHFETDDFYHVMASESPAPELLSIKKSSFRSKRSLSEVLDQLDETFSEMLLRLIDEKELKDPEVYKGANVDKRLFSKIRSNREYSPSKRTVIAFCISLKLSLDESKDLLMKAGYAFSNSSKSDVIIRYFIENKNYNIFEVNEILFSYKLPSIGV